MAPFTKSFARTLQLDPITGVRFFLAMDSEEAAREGGLATSAHCFMNLAVESILAGLESDAIALASKARSWIDQAITQEETPIDYVPDGTEARRFHTRASARWLLDGTHASDDLSRYVECSRRFYMARRPLRNKTEMSFVAPNYVDAGACEQLCELFAMTPGIKRQKEPSMFIRSEGAMSDLICTQRSDHLFDDKLMAATQATFLKRNMNTWLSNGHALRAAIWMKIVHWQRGNAGLTPREAILKCYDYLPASARD